MAIVGYVKVVVLLQSGSGLLLLSKQNKKGLPHKNQRVKLHLHSESLTNIRLKENID